MPSGRYAPRRGRAGTRRSRCGRTRSKSARARGSGAPSGRWSGCSTTRDFAERVCARRPRRDRRPRDSTRPPRAGLRALDPIAVAADRDGKRARAAAAQRRFRSSGSASRSDPLATATPLPAHFRDRRRSTPRSRATSVCRSPSRRFAESAADGRRDSALRGAAGPRGRDGARAPRRRRGAVAAGGNAAPGRHRAPLLDVPAGTFAAAAQLRERLDRGSAARRVADRFARDARVDPDRRRSICGRALRAAATAARRAARGTAWRHSSGARTGAARRAGVRARSRANTTSRRKRSRRSSPTTSRRACCCAREQPT